MNASTSTPTSTILRQKQASLTALEKVLRGIKQTTSPRCSTNNAKLTLTTSEAPRQLDRPWEPGQLIKGDSQYTAESPKV